MFNFNELAIVQPNEPNCYRGSFVGIRQDKYLGKMAFTVPKGFEKFEINYENVKNLFFSMYRTFDKFLENAKKNENLDDKPTGKDNTQIDNHLGAYIFTDEDNNETILYSKIDLIDSIFQLYKEMEIESLIQELGLVEDIDYSKIDRYLDKGIYLDNHAIFIENMVGYRNIVRGVPSELIELFCYIYNELANELKQEVSESIKEISFNFSYKFLSPEQSLFSEYSFESTMNTLKDCLDSIHKTTAYKNGQYWDIYEAVKHFLYGSLEFDSQINKGFWGINNFSYIWEEMCNYMVARHNGYQILYCDTKLPLNQYKDNLSRQNRIWIDTDEIENVFYLDLHGHKRWLRPDIILKNDSHNNFFIKDMMDMEVLEKDEEPSDVLGISGNFDITFKLNLKENFDKSKLEDGQQRFKAIYDFFLKKIFEILNPEENKDRSSKVKKSLKPYMKQLNISKITANSFIIKSIPKKLFDEMLNNILEKDNEENFADKNVKLIDWKYHSNSVFNNSNYRSNSRINESVIKSLAYEFCLGTIISEPIHSQLAIPYYDIKVEDIIIGSEKLDCNIDLVRMNFLKIQEVYLND